MKRLVLVLACISASCTSASPRSDSGEARTRIGAILGRRVLADDAYAPVEDQGTLGIELSREHPAATLGWELGLQASRGSDDQGGSDFEGRTVEVYGGLHRSFGDGPVQPFVGAGLTGIWTELEVDGGGSDDGASLGGYVHGGTRFALGETWWVGIDLRLVFASHVLYEAYETSGDYGQLGLVAGFSF